MRRLAGVVAAGIAAGLATPAMAADRADAIPTIQRGHAHIAPSPGLALVPRMEALPPVTIALPATGDPADAMFRRGFGWAMTNIYPIAGSGLHLSVGSRVGPRAMAGKVMDPAYAPLLLMPRGTGFRSARRFAPAALVGIDRPIAEGMTMGLDGGIVMGRLDNARLGPHAGVGGPFDHAHGSNPMARVTLGYRF